MLRYPREVVVLLVVGGLTWFSKGGWTMYPLLLLSIWSLYVIFNRLAFFATAVPRINRELESIFRGGVMLPDRLEGELAPLLARSIQAGDLDVDAADLAIDRELDNAASLVSTLDTISQAAPMFGLIGTVSGMVKVFNQVSTYKGAVNPSLLANGIAEALIATLVGLSVAIIAYMGYRMFKGRLQKWEGHLAGTVDEVRKMLRSGGRPARPVVTPPEGAQA
jgi:biopolymer transport protein ExbB